MMLVHHAILIGITAALSISTITEAQPVNEALNFNYTPRQCTQWVSAAIASDTVQSASGGLSQSEFMNFLNSIPQLESYFLDTSLFSTNGNGNIITFAGLPFEVQLAYPTLACWCEELGEGEGCCEGENNPRINVSALVEENPSDVAIAYKEDFCAFVALVIRELQKQEEGGTTVATTVATTTTFATSSSTGAAVSTTTSTTTTADDATTTSTTQSSSPSVSVIATVKPTAPTDPIEFTVFGSVINYSLEDPPQTTAKDIMDNSESRNGVIGQLIQGFTKLSLEMLEKCPVSGVVEEKKRTSEPVKLTVLPPGILGSLDDTLVKDIPCPKGLSYAPENASCIAFTIIMKPSDELAQYEEVRSCLNVGIIRAIDDGRLYNIVEDLSMRNAKIFGLGLPGDGVDYLGEEKDVPVVEITEETASTGLGGGFIFLIILALFALPVILFAVIRYRERNEEEMERVREFAGKPADDTDDLDLENPAAPAPDAPATAAATAAPVVAAPLALPKKEEEENESVIDDDDDSSAPSVWSESRGSQADSVVDENATPTSAMMGSSLAAMGVASSVATNLYEKKITGKEEVEEEKLDLETIKAEIKSLVESTAPGKSAEELLSAYGGKEEELLAHLRRLEKETKR